MKTVLWALLIAGPVAGQRFFPDDPLDSEPPPVRVEKAKERRPGEYYDFLRATFTKPGERYRADCRIQAGGVNTLDEVMDGAWYVNRHYRRRMAIQDLVRGPGNDLPPSMEGPWPVVKAKTEGVTPGFTIRDARGQTYMIKFDPPSNIELATAAEVVGARFFYALGFHVPETYIVYFDRQQLQIAPKTTVVEAGRVRAMRQRDLEDVLFRVPRDRHKGYRAVACRYIDGEILGPFLYEGTRADDPNDIVPHEHRRELRGLFVFAAWLGHNDIKCLNTCDALVPEKYIRHYLIDFGASLGSDSFTTKSPRSGYEYLFRWRPTLAQLFTLGAWVPAWARVSYPNFPATGNFEYDLFEPEAWKPNYPATVFDNRLPEDEFWAARQVMSFSEEEIRAIVETGQYSDPRAVDWLVKCLVERRNKIGRTYFTKVLPLDRFRVEADRLAFDDLAVVHGFATGRRYTVRWTFFDNETGRHQWIPRSGTLRLPSEVQRAAGTSFFAAHIASEDESRRLIVYLRKANDQITVIGVDRSGTPVGG